MGSLMKKQFYFSKFLVFSAFLAASSVGAMADGCKYFVRAGDSLSVISQNNLGTYKRWREIYELNPGKVGRGGDLIMVGTVLKMPCDSGVATEALFAEVVKTGQDQSEGLVVVLSEDGDADAIFAKPEPAVAWNAAVGSRLSRVLARWSEEAGYSFVARTKDDWIFKVSFEHRGDFRSALEEVVRGFGLAHVTPSVVIYSNNVVVLN